MGPSPGPFVDECYPGLPIFTVTGGINKNKNNLDYFDFY
jgi:hypothetical protein